MKTKLNFEKGASRTGLERTENRRPSYHTSYILSLISYISSLAILSLVMSCENDEFASALSGKEVEEIVEVEVEVPVEVPGEEVPVPRPVSGTIIETAEDFLKIGDPDYEDDFPLDGEYTLAADITLPEQWEPIGTLLRPFTGKLHGTGHTITMAIPDNHFQYTGLFGYISLAMIDDLKIELTNDEYTPLTFITKNTRKNNNEDRFGTISVDNIDGDYIYIGTVAAYALYSKLINIETYSKDSGAINVINYSGGKISAGGICGTALGSNILNSSSYINFNVDNQGAGTSIGGITGEAKTAGGLTGLTAGGSIVLADYQTGTYANTVYAGGIAGWVDNANIVFTNNTCKSKTIKISVRPKIELDLGGVCGNAQCLVSNCSVASELEITADTNQTAVSGTTIVYKVLFIGGIAGLCGTVSGSSTPTINQGKGIQNCFIPEASKVSITLDTEANTYIVAGGLLGAGPVDKSYIASSDSYVYVKKGTDKYINATARLGGLVGEGSISNSYSFCNVRFETSTSSGMYGGLAAGGLAGWLPADKTIEYSYVKGKVEFIDVCSGSDITSANSMLTGGIAGYTVNATSSKIQYCADFNSEISIDNRAVAANPHQWNFITPYNITSNLQNNVSNVESPPDNNTYVVQSGGTYSNYVDGTAAAGCGEAVTDEDITEDLFKTTLGWDFDTIWKWDSALGLPVLR